ncbi:hypothetical protein [Spiroplasma sp. DGKH1]|uniref:hypothetical protein n=1 Tax=Spiroplasma sp. DGKH1 TaxID=3050074 RepID=UPI0034C5EAEA
MSAFGDQKVINTITDKKLRQVVKNLLALRLNYTIVERIVKSKRELNNNEKFFVLSIIKNNNAFRQVKDSEKIPAKVKKQKVTSGDQKVKNITAPVKIKKPLVKKAKPMVQQKHHVKPRLQVTAPIIITKQSKPGYFAKRDIYNEIKSKVLNLRNAVNTYHRDGRTVSKWENPYFNHTFPYQNQLLNANKTH